MSAERGVARRAAAVAQVFVEDLGDLALDPEDLHHLARVRRLRDGEVVVAADGAGGWRLCRFRSGPHPALEADGPPEADPAADPVVSVAFAPVKGERTEWAVQKLTELGVDRIVVLAADRSVVRWSGDRGTRALERLRRVAREAAAQARRSRLPEIEGPRSLGALADTGDEWCLADLGGPGLAPRTAAIAVGPEGGWSPEERALGLPTVGLGGQVLRSETAAVSAGVLLGALRAGTVAPNG